MQDGLTKKGKGKNTIPEIDFSKLRRDELVNLIPEDKPENPPKDSEVKIQSDKAGTYMNKGYGQKIVSPASKFKPADNTLQGQQRINALKYTYQIKRLKTKGGGK